MQINKTISTPFSCKMGHHSYPQKWFPNSMGWFSSCLHRQLSNGEWIQDGYEGCLNVHRGNGMETRMVVGEYVNT